MGRKRMDELTGAISLIKNEDLDSVSGEAGALVVISTTLIHLLNTLDDIYLVLKKIEEKYNV